MATARAIVADDAAEDTADPLAGRARLFATPDNPIPAGARVGRVETEDGFRIRHARWQAAVRPSKGTVILLNGRSECIEKSFETVHDLRLRGFGVLAFDWRGQGGSTRLIPGVEKGHIDTFGQYVTDLETVLRRIALPDCRPPYYLMGHSTGALVALLAAPDLTNQIRRMVLVSPLLRLAGLPVRQGTIQKVFGALTLLGAGKLSAVRNWQPPETRNFIANKLTSDTHRFQRTRQLMIDHPHLRTGPPTVGWVFAACRAMEEVTVPGHSNAIAIPSLFVAAGHDTVVSPGAIEAYGRSMRSGAFLTIPGARHEILDERDVYREQLLAAFDAFVPGTEV